MFGRSKRRSALIKELCEYRMKANGLDDRSIRLEIRGMGSLKVMGLPEATIVTIVEIAAKNQKRGELLQNTLTSLERTRKIRGQDAEYFSLILKEARVTTPYPPCHLTACI